MKKVVLVCVLFICLATMTGCLKKLTYDNGYAVETSDDLEYDYRNMYLKGDTGNLTGKELEAFNAACKIYKLYIEKSGSDYDKIKAAHDYIVRNCTYNKEAIDNDTLSDDDFTEYGTLVKGLSVCEGYAKAFMMLMNIADIECMMVTGRAGENDVLHAWNMVKLDGKWYHIDVTFDDPYPETDEIVYLYFNISDDIIAKDHTWDTELTPEADDNSYDIVNNKIKQLVTVEEFYLFINSSINTNENNISFVWTGKELIDDMQWRKALSNTSIANASYSCVGVEGRRLYMVKFGY